MGGSFYLVLNMSITASAIGLAVAAVRTALRGRAAVAAYALWAVVLARLVLPFSFPSEASVFNLISRYIKPIASFPEDGTHAVTFTNSIGAVNAYFPMHFKTSGLTVMFNTAGEIWLVGFLLAAACAILLYALTAARLSRSLPSRQASLLGECSELLGVRRKIRLVVSDEVSSPVVFGLIHPRIVIPKALDEDTDMLRFALLHELVHIHRGDNILRVVSAGMACLHWFNPLVWLFLCLAGRDMEMACDAGVLRRLPDGERRGYALALMSLAAGRQPMLAPAFGSSVLRSRIIGIVKYRRLSGALAALIAALLFALAVVLLTNPAV